MFQALGPIMQRALPALSRLMTPGGTLLGSASAGATVGGMGSGNLPKSTVDQMTARMASTPLRPNGPPQGQPGPGLNDMGEQQGSPAPAPQPSYGSEFPPAPSAPALPQLAGAPKITPAPFGLGASAPGRMNPINWGGGQETGSNSNPFPTPLGQQETGHNGKPFPMPSGQQATGNDSNPFPQPTMGASAPAAPGATSALGLNVDQMRDRFAGARAGIGTSSFPSFFNPQVG